MAERVEPRLDLHGRYVCAFSAAMLDALGADFFLVSASISAWDDVELRLDSSCWRSVTAIVDDVCSIICMLPRCVCENRLQSTYKTSTIAIYVLPTWMESTRRTRSTIYIKESNFSHILVSMKSRHFNAAPGRLYRAYSYFAFAYRAHTRLKKSSWLRGRNGCAHWGASWRQGLPLESLGLSSRALVSPVAGDGAWLGSRGNEVKSAEKLGKWTGGCVVGYWLFGLPPG